MLGTLQQHFEDRKKKSQDPWSPAVGGSDDDLAQSNEAYRGEDQHILKSGRSDDRIFISTRRKQSIYVFTCRFQPSKGRRSGGVQGGDDGLLGRGCQGLSGGGLAWPKQSPDNGIGLLGRFRGLWRRLLENETSSRKQLDEALRMVALHGWNGRQTAMVEAANPGRRLEFEIVLTLWYLKRKRRTLD
ncbi:hypothetical protein GQ457_06G000210 [Hibiscus cannabinus]